MCAPDAGASNFAASSSSSSSPSGHPAVLSSATGRHAKQQASVSCPFVGCPSFRRHMSKDALVSHLSARHVASGQTVPDAVLRMVKHLACATCRTLYREGAHCQCHGQQIISDASVGVSHALPPPVHLAPGGMPTVPCTSLNAPCPALVPTLEELLASTVPTVRHIPNACRGPVSSCLSSLLEAFVLQRSWEALHRLQCFPKLVLRSSKRAGKAHAKQIASDIQRRLRLFNGGHLATLWSEATTVAQRPKVVRTRAQVQAQEGLSPGAIRTIHSLVEEGALSKAAKHLLSEGLADASDPSVLERLRALHPTAPPVVTGGDTALPDFLDPRLSDADDACDWGKLAWKAVSSFSPGSAPGPSGLRPGHLKECLQKEGRASSLQGALGSLAQLSIERGLPAAASTVLCASNLIPLRKKDGSVRPIGVDTLRRVVGKCLLELDQAK